MTGWAFFLDRRPWSSDRLFVARDSGRGARAYVTITLHESPEGAPVDTPTLSETREEKQDAVGDVTGFLQGALECAWESGLRPRGFADHHNELTATQTHLEDMRALVFKTPKPEGKRP